MYKKEIKRILKHSRPRFWLYLLGPVLVAAASVGVQAFATIPFWAFFLYTTLPANIYLYGVNDIADKDTDKYNKKKEGKERRAKKQDSVLQGVITTSFLLGIGLLFLITLDAALILLLYFFLATFYSLPPLRFKAKPFIDSFSNILYILPGIALYTTLTNSLPSLSIIFAGWMWTAAMHLFSAIPDIEPDTKAGLQTTATVLGREKSLVLCSVLWGLTTLSISQTSLILSILSLVYPLLCFLPLLNVTEVEKQYWWYPYINGFSGFTLFWFILLPTLL